MPLQLPIPIDGNPTRLIIYMRTPYKRFTETHWLSATTSPPLLSVPADVNTLAIKRAACLGNDSFLDYIRMSQDNVFMDSLVTDQNAPIAGLAGATQSYPADPGGISLRVRLEATSQHRRALYMAGIPDQAVRRGAYQVGELPMFDTNLEDYLGFLTGQPGSSYSAHPFGYVAITKDAGVAPRVKILSVSTVVAAPLGNVTVATTAPHLLAPGDTVRISRWPGANAALPINTLFIVRIVSSPIEFTITIGVPTTTVTIQAGGGWAQKMLLKLVPYSGYLKRYVDSKRRGNRSGQPLGRFKKKHTIGY